MTFTAKITVDPEAARGDLSGANPSLLTYEANVISIMTRSLASKGICLHDVKFTKDQDHEKTPDRAQGDDLARRNVTPTEQKLSERDADSEDSEKSTSDDDNKKPSEDDDATKDAASPTSTEKPADEAKGSLTIPDVSGAKKSTVEESPVPDADKNEKPAAEAVNTSTIPDGSDPKNEKPAVDTSSISDGSADADPKASKEPSDNLHSFYSEERGCYLYIDKKVTTDNKPTGASPTKNSDGINIGGDIDSNNSKPTGASPTKNSDGINIGGPRTSWGGPTGGDLVVHPKASKDAASPESPTTGTTARAASDSDDNLSPPSLDRRAPLVNPVYQVNPVYHEPIIEFEEVKVFHLVQSGSGGVPMDSKEGKKLLCEGPEPVLLLKNHPENQDDMGMGMDVDSDDDMSHKEKHEGHGKKPGTSRPSDSSSDLDDSDDEAVIVRVKEAPPKPDSDSDDSDSSSVSSDDDSHQSGSNSKAPPARAKVDSGSVDSARAKDSSNTESEDNNNDSDVGTDGAHSTRPSATVDTTVTPTGSGTGGKRKSLSTNFYHCDVKEPVSKKKKYMQKGPTPKILMEKVDDAATILEKRPTFNRFDTKLENVRKQEWHHLKAVRETYKKKKEQAIREDNMAVDGPDDEPRSALPRRRNDEGGAPGASSASGVSA